MMMRVEDLIIKTLLSAEVPIANACRMFLPHRENCFELFGFDVIFGGSGTSYLEKLNLNVHSSASERIYLCYILIKGPLHQKLNCGVLCKWELGIVPGTVL